MSIMLVNDQKQVVENDLNTLVKFFNRYGYSWESEDLTNKHYSVWLQLNYRSFNNKYEEDVLLPEKVKVNQVGNSHYDNYCQLLKRLECIRYNIEVEHCKPDYKEMESIEVLNETIDALKSWIINSLDDYKAASWS